MSKSNDVVVVPNFSSNGAKLRQQFDTTFADARGLNSKRFVWDHWQIKNQYQLLRTPSAEFFDKKNYESLLNDILTWGQTHLGCHSLSSPWLSCYVEGGYQNYHTDIEQGPWAFVYSLSPKKIKFDGGETQIFRTTPITSKQNSLGSESHQLMHTIQPKFNQLTVFDPSLAHGVSRVSGVNDVSEGRLVIHGWFGYPSPFVVGALERNDKQIKSSLNQALELFYQKFKDESLNFDHKNTYFNFCLAITPSGKVTNVELLPLHEKIKLGVALKQQKLLKEYATGLRNIMFPKATSSSRLYLPIYI